MIVAAVFTASICVLIVRYSLFSGTKGVEDEAKLAGLTTSDFPQITSDIFRGMDDGTDLSPDEIMGRNAWNLWTAGNERFWNHVAQDSRGIIDLLKSMDNRTYKRGERFRTLGLMNQPGFRPPTRPDQFGLWLDELLEPEPAGVDEKIYGKPTGVLGFRLFPNPDFNEIARQKWNAQRYISDPGYYEDTKLVRPYRVGVSCGACHIGPNPNNPPCGKSFRYRYPSEGIRWFAFLYPYSEVCVTALRSSPRGYQTRYSNTSSIFVPQISRRNSRLDRGATPRTAAPLLLENSASEIDHT